ncbi:uncharacterized protein LOC113769413 [Coffea eugenioides]|uniref:uncharacterized protein LOC113769413 n=1 Tax=Coffea eugenioides TaxID=49369 RepID=UPI000F60DEE8|nr:uncharacterized protein LOC113769413 [Coffea eugenioides]
MDKTWMQKNRRSKEYWDGLQKFLDYAFQNSSINGMILCPCKECKCGVCITRENAELHLKVYGFVKGYTHWAAHGEFVYSSAPKPTSYDISHGVRDELDDMHGLVHDAMGIPEQDYTRIDGTEYKSQLPNVEAEKFYNLIDNSNKELYSGCKRFSKLSFMIRLLHLKCLGKLSNKIFDMLLDLLKEAFPDAMDGLPKSYYEAEKLMKELGLGYDKYDACPNDCTLYWGVDARRKHCETCKESRWVKSENDSTGHMRWHAEGHTKDGNMRHPADSPSWQTFDFHHPEFSQDSRNVRLGLASDGFNPFKNMSSTHSTWPVMQSSPDGALKENLHVLYAINTHLHSICVIGENIAIWGIEGTLEMNHPFRKDAKSFNGAAEYGKPPGRLMGSTILDELAGYSIKLGKTVSDNPELPFNWKKLSIFFDLPYWKDNMIRHNLDVMHIEKNICEIIVATLLNLEKTKDNKKSRHDLRDMGIRSELHPIEKGNGRSVLPPACFTMKKKENEIFCKVLKGIKVPDGYAANISRCVKVKPPKISGLKSHDYHILMQQLLPIALRRTLSKAVRSPLVKLSSEAKIGGPVHYRWMYPIERYLGTLKSYVRNRSRPEGCIAEGQHHKMVKEQNPCAGKHVIERIHCENFADWFSDHVKQIQVADGVDISKDLKLLARGPNNVGRTYQKILVNGFRFHTRQLESQRKTQNSGVLVNATTSSFSSTKDNNPILSDLAYYGILTNILELNYTEGRTVTLFECDWISKGKRLKQDEDGFTLANFKNVKPHPEPYVIATQVSQVFYVEDPLAEGWSVVVATSPRNEFMMDPVCDIEMYLQRTITSTTQMDNENEDIRWVREDDGDEILH